MGTCAISKVKGHTDDEMVRRGRVRLVDKVGNDWADEAADLGRRGVDAAVTDSRRHLVQACRYWYPIVYDLHRFFLAIARAAVNDDGLGGIAPNPLVWSVGSLPKRRRVIEAVEDFATLPGSGALWDGGWFDWPQVSVTDGDVRV